MVKFVFGKALEGTDINTSPTQFCLLSLFLGNDCNKEDDFWDRTRSFCYLFSDENAIESHQETLQATWSQCSNGQPEAATTFAKIVDEATVHMLSKSEAKLYLDCAHIVLSGNPTTSLKLSQNHISNRAQPKNGPSLVDKIWWPTLVVGMYRIIFDAHPKKHSTTEMKGHIESLVRHRAHQFPKNPTKNAPRNKAAPAKSKPAPAATPTRSSPRKHPDKKKAVAIAKWRKDKMRLPSSKRRKTPTSQPSKTATSQHSSPEHEGSIPDEDGDSSPSEGEHKGSIPDDGDSSSSDGDSSSLGADNEVNSSAEEEEMATETEENFIKDPTTEHYDICPIDILEERVRCHFLLKTESQHYSLQVGEHEIYSALRLDLSFHGRQLCHPISPWSYDRTIPTVVIPSKQPQFLDALDHLHVIRPSSSNLPNVDWSFLVKCLRLCGIPETGIRGVKGPSHMLRLHIGYAHPPVATQFCGFKKARDKLISEKLDAEDCRRFFVSLGILASHTYSNMAKLQSLSGNPKRLSPNIERDSIFASNVRNVLEIRDLEAFRCELVIPSITRIYPIENPSDYFKEPHLDKSNCVEEGYDRCGCMDTILKNDSGSEIILFQMILANRASSARWLSKDNRTANTEGDHLSEDQVCTATGEHSEENTSGNDVQENWNHQDDRQSTRTVPFSFEWNEKCKSPTVGTSSMAYMEAKDELHLEPWIVGGLTHYFGANIPLHLFVPLVSYYKSQEYNERFLRKSGKINYYNTSTGASNANAYPHSEYLMAGGEDNFSKEEKVFMQSLERGLKEALGENFRVVDHDCGILHTINGQFHQPTHVDTKNALHNPPCSAYVGHMGVEPEGSILRLEVLSQEAMALIREGKEIPSDVGLWTDIVYVHIPFGSILLIDAQQFHGGHYGSNGVFRFHCVFSSFQWRSSTESDELMFLSRLTSHGIIPRPKFDLKMVGEKMAPVVANVSELRKTYNENFDVKFWETYSEQRCLHCTKFKVEESGVQQLDRLYELMSLTHENKPNVLKPATLTGKILTRIGQERPPKEISRRFKGAMFYYLGATDTCHYLGRNNAYPLMVERSGTKMSIERFYNLTRDSLFKDTLRYLGKNLTKNGDWLALKNNLAGTLLVPSRTTGIGVGNVAIAELSKGPFWFGSCLHATIRGNYWLVMGVPRSFPQSKLFMDDNSLFYAWMKTLGQEDRLLHQRIQKACDGIVCGDPSAFKLVAIKCESGTVVISPCSTWKHCVIEIGDDRDQYHSLQKYIG